MAGKHRKPSSSSRARQHLKLSTQRALLTFAVTLAIITR